jgi:hypothetical protein
MTNNTILEIYQGTGGMANTTCLQTHARKKISKKRSLIILAGKY